MENNFSMICEPLFKSNSEIYMQTTTCRNLRENHGIDKILTNLHKKLYSVRSLHKNFHKLWSMFDRFKKFGKDSISFGNSKTVFEFSLDSWAASELAQNPSSTLAQASMFSPFH